MLHSVVENYDPRCACCWLNHQHTEEAHREHVEAYEQDAQEYYDRTVRPAAEAMLRARRIFNNSYPGHHQNRMSVVMFKRMAELTRANDRFRQAYPHTRSL